MDGGLEIFGLMLWHAWPEGETCCTNPPTITDLAIERKKSGGELEEVLRVFFSKKKNDT